MHGLLPCELLDGQHQGSILLVFPLELRPDAARRRLIFEELFVLQLGLCQLKTRNRRETSCFLTADRSQEFFSCLPFPPTGAQRRAVAECVADMRRKTPMNRLIQGDVGSGKTLVAAACVWYAAQSGAQSAFMAPTEILAEQHFATLSGFLAPFGLRVAKLTGSMRAAEKRAVLAGLASGEVDLCIGTHALLSEGVEFKDLALVVTDEQHRFGVQQRSELAAKGAQPHILVMSATPIPRTLALMIYGDLDVSVIDELPPGRRSIETYAVPSSYHERIYAFLEKQLAEVQPKRESIKKRMRELRDGADKELMEQYLKFRKDGAPPVFVKARVSGNDYSCYCGMQLSPSSLGKLKADGMCRCDTCRRIVYIDS